MLYLVRFKKALNGFVKNGVYLFNSTYLVRIPSNAIEHINLNAIKPYTNQNTLLIIRSGGMGDLIALSVLQDIAPRTMLLTRKQYAPAIDLWQKRPAMKYLDAPLFTAKSMEELYKIISNIGILYGEDIIEQGSDRNWYEVFYAAASQPIGPLRPQLKPNTKPTKAGCLIVSNATSVNRTANILDIVSAASQHFDSVTIAHEQQWTTKQYIDAVSSYSHCISVDTSAVHIREGLGLPTLALYGAFTTDCRTRGYIYTKAIQLTDYPFTDETTPRCTPCFKHGYNPCSKSIGQPYAPCLNDMVKILSGSITDWLTTNPLP